jgi:hypothetical protein
MLHMVAVPETPVSAPVGVAATGSSAASNRAVAVAVSSKELLRPGSDLVRLVEGFPQVEVLVPADDGHPEEGHMGWVGSDDPDNDDVDGPGDRLRAVVAARLRLPGLRVHRLGLSDPLPATAEDDLVAALSELIGFDPEPGVYCLAPAPDPADPAPRAVNRAVQRIAQVYGIPLLRYRTLELAVAAAAPS